MKPFPLHNFAYKKCAIGDEGFEKKGQVRIQISRLYVCICHNIYSFVSICHNILNHLSLASHKWNLHMSAV